MKCYITTTSFGFIATNQDNEIIDYKLFEKKQVQKLQEIQKKLLLQEEIELIKSIITYYDEIIIETAKPQSAYSHVKDNDKIIVKKTTSHGRYIRSHLEEIVHTLPGLETVDVRRNLNKIYMEIAQEKIRESVKTNDVMIVETINSLEEIEETTGKLIERLREWCMPYLPELDRIHNHELYSKIISTRTTRDNIKNCSLLDSTGIELKDTNDIEMSKEDLLIIKNFAASLHSLYQTKNSLEEYIRDKIKDVAPNLYDVAGASLSAKLIAHVNGLENLAKLPSSTVQIIGAEKATFRHLKTGERPPKHGLIFQHPSIRGSNWWIRGKLARAIASKITIAARKDAFGNEYDPDLKVQLDEKIEKIKKDNPFPERKKKKEQEKGKKGKKNRKERKKKKNRKKKLRKGEYSY